MGALAVAVGYGLGEVFVPRPGWWDDNAILDADYPNARFRWDGQSFADEASFNAGIGGSKSGLQRVIGPYVDPAAPELIVNGDFSGGTLANWASVLNGSSSVSVVSGAAQVTSDGSTGNGVGGAGMTQGFATVLDKAYRIVFSTTSAGTISTRIGAVASPTSPGAIAKNLGPGLSTLSTWSAYGATSYLYPYRGGVGVSAIDNISVKECRPFKNFVQGGVTARVRGTTPAAAAGTKVALALSHVHDTEEAQRVYLAYSASGELHVFASYQGNTVADLNLGAVAVSTPFDVWLTATTNDFAAMLNDGVAVGDLSGGLPGFGAMFVGRDTLGNNWDGSELRVQVYAGGGKARMYGLVDRTIHFEGDSFAGGAYTVLLPRTLNTTMARPVYNTGVGGNTIDQITARLIAAPADIRAKTTVVWDGDQNGIISIADYCDKLATAFTALGHGRFVVIPPCTNYGQSDVSQELAIRDEMLRRWPGNMLDWRNFLILAAPNGSPMSSMFANLPTDTTHLSQEAMELCATAISDFLVAKGW
jgi:hypothetical protein